MRNKKFGSRKLRYGGISVLITALIIAMVVMVNVIFTALAEKDLLRLDLTPTELYSLSDEFITLIEEGDPNHERSTDAPIEMIDKFREEKEKDDLEINIIFCEEKDKLYEDETQRYVQQTAQQIANEFDGYVNIDYVDVVRNPSAVSKFKVTSDVHIPSTSIIVEFDGKFKILPLRSFYVFAETDTTTPVGYNGEKQFAKAIMEVTRAATPIACLINNHGENVENIGEFRNTLEAAGYEVRELNLYDEEIPEDCRLVVVFGPKNDFRISNTGMSDVDEIDKLEDYLFKGRSMMVFMDPEAPELPNFEEFIAEWGITFNRHEGDAKYVVDKNQALNASGQTFKAQYSPSGNGHDLLGAMADEENPQTIVFKNAMAITYSDEFKMQHYTPQDSSDPDDVPYDYGFNDPYAIYDIFMSTSNATEVSNGEIIANKEGKPYSLMTVSEYSVRVQTDPVNGFSTQIPSHIIACGSTEFASNEFLQTTAYGNTDALLMLMSNIGLEIVPVGLKYKPFADTTIDTIEVKDANVFTVILVALPAVAALVSGAIVLIRRKYR